MLRSRSRYFLVGAGVKVPAPSSGSSLDQTEENLNDILFVRYNIDQMLV